MNLDPEACFLGEIDSFLSQKGSSVVPLAFLIAVLRLGLPLDSSCFRHNPSLQRKLHILLHQQASCSGMVRSSLKTELWVLHWGNRQPPFGIDNIHITRSVANSNSTSSWLPGTAFLPYSQSRCWSIQKEYYKKAELLAWEANGPVPCGVSSNIFVAKQYLDIITNQAEQAAAIQGCDKEPFIVTIVEAGAGHGAVSLLLARLLSHNNSSNAANNIQYRVICTDFHAGVFVQLLTLPWVKQLCEHGYLNFGVLDADTVSTDESKFHLLYKSKKEIHHPISNLLVVVGQYLFDSLATDLFAVSKEEGLFEIGVASLDHDKELNNNIRKRKWKNSGKKERYVVRPFHPSDSVYDQAVYKKLLDIQNSIHSYHDSDGDGIVAVPKAGKQLLETIQRAFPVITRGNSSQPQQQDSYGNVLMLVGDFIMAHDDVHWQGKQLSAELKSVSAKLDQQQHDNSMSILRQDKVLDVTPWLHPPVISPRSSIIALPVCLHGLDLIFDIVFPQKKQRQHTHPWHNFHSVQSLSPVASSSFSVVVLSNYATTSTTKFESQNLLKFGPGDYQNMKTYLIGDEAHAHFNAFVSKQFLYNFLKLGFNGMHNPILCELSTFMQFRWQILQKFRSEYIYSMKLSSTNINDPDFQTNTEAKPCTRENIVSLLEIPLHALYSGMHHMLSLKEAIQCKSQLCQWLLSLSSFLRNATAKSKIITNPKDQTQPDMMLWRIPLLVMLHCVLYIEYFGCKIKFIGINNILDDDSYRHLVLVLDTPEQRVMVGLAKEYLDGNVHNSQDKNSEGSSSSNDKHHLGDGAIHYCSRKNREYICVNKRRHHQLKHM